MCYKKRGTLPIRPATFTAANDIQEPSRIKTEQVLHESSADIFPASFAQDKDQRQKIYTIDLFSYGR